MKLGGIVLAGACVLAGIGPARADTQPADRLGDFYISDTPMVLLANGSDKVGVDRLISSGDVVLETTLGYATTATLSAPRAISVAGITQELPNKKPIYRVEARGGDLKALDKDAKIFCAAPSYGAKPDPAAPATPGITPGKRLLWETQLCLVDADHDGAFEHAFIIGTKQQPDRHITPIAPLAYSEAVNQPVPDGVATITYRKGAGLVMAINIGGLDAQASDYSTAPADAKPAWFSAVRGVKSDTYPREVTFGAVVLSIESFDMEARQAHIVVKHAFETVPLRMKYPGPTVIYIYVPPIR